MGVYVLVKGDDEGSYKLCHELKKILNKINTTYMIIIMGDFKARADIKLE
jgi:hypothetical protein